MELGARCRKSWTGLLAALSLAGLPALGGCVVHHHHREAPPAAGQAKHPGPPDHAPAHGHRRKHAHDPVELVFDAEVGVYVVAGRTAVYWDGERYLAWHDGHWRVSVRIDGVWVGVGSDAVPAKLARRHEKAHKQHGKKRGHGHGSPAKHAR